MTQAKEMIEIKPLALMHEALAYELGMTDAYRHVDGRRPLSQAEANGRGCSMPGWGQGFNKGMEIEQSKKNGYQKRELTTERTEKRND